MGAWMIWGGNKKLLKKSEKQLLEITELKNNPTYGALDQVRRDVGDALGKQSGPFKGDEEAILNEVYGALSNDQQGVADAFKVGAEYAAGRKLVSTRKDLERETLKLFGRELETGSIIPKLKSGAEKLTRGDISGFQRLMNSLPKNRRQEAAATMLNDLFTLGQGRGAPLGGGFASAFRGLNKNPGAKKILFDQLPPEALKTFNDLGKVATGIFKAKKFENVSGTGRAIIAAMNDGGIIEKVIESGVVRGVSRVTPSLGLIANTISGGIRKAKTEGTDKAIDLLTSPAFKQSLEDAALGNRVRAERIQRTKAFKDWLTAQPPDIKTEIAAIGFIPWVTGELGDPRLELRLEEAN